MPVEEHLPALYALAESIDPALAKDFQKQVQVYLFSEDDPTPVIFPEEMPSVSERAKNSAAVSAGSCMSLQSSTVFERVSDPINSLLASRSPILGNTPALLNADETLAQNQSSEERSRFKSGL